MVDCFSVLHQAPTSKAQLPTTSSLSSSSTQEGIGILCHWRAVTMHFIRDVDLGKLQLQKHNYPRTQRRGFGVLLLSRRHQKVSRFF